MKKINLYIIPSLALALASCAEGYEGTLAVDKPESVVEAEQLASLGTLREAVDKSMNPNFRLGLQVSAADYASKGVTYSIALSNFDMVTDAGAMAYSAIFDGSGSCSLTPVTDMVIADSPAVAAGDMLAYNALPKAWLESTISPTFVKGDLATGNVTVADFDTDPEGSAYEMSNGSISTVTADPAGGEGHVLQIGSPDNKAKNTYAVIKMALPDGLTVGNITSVSFDLYCPDANSQKKNFVAIVNGVRKNYTGDTPDKRGCPLNTWSRKLALDMSAVALGDAERNATELTLCLGPNVNNSYYYIDNITFAWSTGEADKYVEKNDAEKAQALADNFSLWAGSIMEATAASISEYTVIANPMSDAAPFALRTAASEIECGNDTTGCFFFNDYMGDNFVKTVTDCLSKAYADNGGSASTTFYVKESGLAGNMAKTQAFLTQIDAWTKAGAKIDGISVDLSSAGNAGVQEISDLFKLLSASGKLIRIENLPAGAADSWGDFIGEYFRQVGADRRGGIIFNGTGSLWKNNSRTKVYEAVFNAMHQ